MQWSIFFFKNSNVSASIGYIFLFNSSPLKMYLFSPSVIMSKGTSVIKTKIYSNGTLVLKHIFPKHVIIYYVTLKSVNLFLEAHFILSYNYANSMMQNYPK